MKLLRVIAALSLVGAPAAARACSVCMGANETVGEAANGAIFVMLGCIFSMFALILGVAFHFWRRQQQPTTPPLV